MREMDNTTENANNPDRNEKLQESKNTSNMSGDTTFMTFDTAPLVDVKAKGWVCSTREFLLGVFAACLLLLCLVFVWLYAARDTQSAMTSTEKKGLCLRPDCLKVSLHAQKLMDSSIDPCNDFYSYACGNYHLKYPHPIGERLTASLLSDMVSANLDNIMESLTGKDFKGDFDRKAADLYKSCMDVGQRERLRGKPFLDKVISALGGWYVLGDWSETSWDLNNVLKKVQVDFLASGLYGIRMFPHYDNQSVISIHLELPKFHYVYGFSVGGFQERSEKFKDFTDAMKRVAFLFVRDSKMAGDLNNDDEIEIRERVNQFVNDSLLMEMELSDKLMLWSMQPPDFLPISLSTLNSMTYNSVDWVDQLSYYFPEKDITGDTQVILEHKEALIAVVNITNSLPAVDKNRILHNFLIGRVILELSEELSTEYVELRHKMSDGHVWATSKPSWRCENLVMREMVAAMGAIYVQNRNLSKIEFEKVRDITRIVKESLQSQLNDIPWMDRETRDYAKQKLNKIVFNIGFPNWLSDPRQMDAIYSTLEINSTEYFNNILGINQYKRFRRGHQNKHGRRRQIWRTMPYEAKVNVDYGMQEITVPLGFLRGPVWHDNAPQYVLFGSLGGAVGSSLVNTIDKEGSKTDLHGNWRRTSWWSHNTTANFKRELSCVNDLASHSTRWINKREVISITSGIQLALTGYRHLIGDKEGDLSLPGLDHLSPSQMLFVSYTQALCKSERKTTPPHKATLEAHLELNMALGQLQEFTDAFQCPKGSNMNHKTRCIYY